MSPPPVDLARERRVRDRVAELHALLDGNAALAVRTFAALDGSLPCPDLEDAPMPPRPDHVCRVPADLWTRADRLCPSLATAPALRAWGRVTPSAVVRLALLRGLEALEADARANDPDLPGNDPSVSS